MPVYPRLHIHRKQCDACESKMCDEITYPFPNFNGEMVEVWEWINNSIQHILMDVITYPCWD